MVINAIWDDVIIMPYNFDGINDSFPAQSVTPNYPRGTVNYIGPNVDRVSVGQLVVFKQGPYLYDGTNTWAVVPQESILATITPIV